MINNPRELAVRMAALARFIREAILRALTDEDEGGSACMIKWKVSGKSSSMICRRDLLRTCTPRPSPMASLPPGVMLRKKGLSSASMPHIDLPKTNPFLRRMFSHIAGPDLDNRIVWIVDDLTNLLDRTDMSAVLHDFGRRTRREDPIVHFYETFLAAYDPKMREVRGVYYTPEPVVSYIVRSIDHILKNDFGLADGLADTSKVAVRDSQGEEKNVHRVLILDPGNGHRNVPASGHLPHLRAHLHERTERRMGGRERLRFPTPLAKDLRIRAPHGALRRRPHETWAPTF